MQLVHILAGRNSILIYLNECCGLAFYFFTTHGVITHLIRAEYNEASIIKLEWVDMAVWDKMVNP